MMEMSLNKWLLRSGFCKCFVQLLLFVSVTEALRDGATWRLEAAPRASWVLLESSISINCLNLTSKLTIFASEIRWYKLANDGTIKYLSTSLDARVRSNGHQLQIFNAKADDEGRYCCIPVNNVSILNCNELAVANLSVAQPPIIATPVRHQTAKIGDVVILQCYISFVGKPAAIQYSWQKFGRNLALRQSKYTTLNLTDLFILIIHNVTEKDEGLYSCYLINTKYQKANGSIYLQVPRIIRNDSSERCDQSINTTLFVGLYTASKQSCNYMQNMKIDDLLTAFASSLCNCTKLCVNANIFGCLNVSMAVVKITLQGSKAMETYSTLKALLQRTHLHIQDSDYLLTCFSPWCNAENVTNNVIPTVLETSLESNCDIEILIFCLLVILLLLTFAMAIKYYSKTNHLNAKKQTSSFNAASQPTTTKDTQQHYVALNNLKQTV